MPQFLEYAQYQFATLSALDMSGTLYLILGLAALVLFLAARVIKLQIEVIRLKAEIRRLKGNPLRKLFAALKRGAGLLFGLRTEPQPRSRQQRRAAGRARSKSSSGPKGFEGFFDGGDE